MPQSSPVKNAISLGIGTGISRILGLVRDILFAYVLGAGWVADIFLAAFRLPNFSRRLLQEGGLFLPFIPVFRREEAQYGLPQAFAFGRSATLELAFAVALITMLGLAGAQTLAKAFLPGLSGDAMLMGQATSLLRISLFYLPLAVIVAAGSGMLMALGRYSAPSASPAALNIGLLCAGFYVLGGGLNGYGAARALCIGLLAGGVLQLLLQWVSLCRQGFKIIGPVNFSGRGNKSFLRSLPASLIGSAAFQLNVIIATILASFLNEGSISALYYAERLIELPVALVGVTLGTASLSGFSAMIIEGRRNELGAEIRRVLRAGFFLTLPCAFGLICFSMPIIQAIFGRGAFDTGAATLTGTALVCYAPALPAVAASRTLLAALNASGRATVTVTAALISLGCMVIFALLLMPLLQVAGLALAGSIAAWINLALLCRALKSGKLHGGQGFMPWQAVAMYGLMSLGMSVVALAVNAAALHFLWGNFLRLGLGIPLCAAFYLGLAAIAHSPELAKIGKIFASK